MQGEPGEGLTWHMSPPPYFTEPNFVDAFLYCLVKAKLAYALNTINLLSIFTMNLLL